MTHNYHYYANWAWAVDRLLLVASLLLSAMIVFYVAIKEYRWKRRSRALLNIKNHVYELLLAGEKNREEETRRLAATITPRQFLDITTTRELIFFNDSEQAVFKKYFLTPEKITKIKRMAERSINKWRRIEAIAVLGYAGIHDAVEIIAKSLFNKDEDISYFSMISLSQIKDADAAKALIKLLKKNPLNGNKIVSILENFPENTVMAAGDLLKDKIPNVRLWTLVLLSRFKAEAKRRIKEIEKLLEDKDTDVRAAACDCLGRTGDKSEKELLAKYLRDDSWLMRATAVKALSALLGKDSIPVIAGVIGDPSLSVIDSVKDVMLIHIETAMPHLERFLYEKDAVARRVAVEVMEESGELSKILGILASGNSAEKPHAVRLLKGMVGSGAHLGLETAIAKFDGNLQKNILETIKKIDPVLEAHIEKKLNDQICEIPK